MKKIFILFIIFTTFLKADNLNELYEKSLKLAKNISAMEQNKIADTMNKLNKDYDKNAEYIEKERSQGHFQIKTTAPTEYKKLVKENAIEGLEFLTKITVIFYEEDSFYLMIESGMLDAIMGDSIVIDLLGTYEEISKLIESLEVQLSEN